MNGKSRQRENKQNLPLASVIILNYNGKNYLKNCLKSVLNTNYPNFEIIVIDNASTDGSAEYVEEMARDNPQIKLIRNKVNLGFAEGNNIGINYAKGDIVVFLNNDTEVDADWLKEIAAIMVTDRLVGAVQPKILLLSKVNERRIDSVGGDIDILGFVYEKGRLEKDLGQYNKTNEVFWAKGSAMAVKRHVLEEVGGFDPDYFISYEDVDLSWRIRLKGYKILYCPSSIVYHKGGSATKRKPTPFIVFHMTKNHILTLLKNYSLVNILKYCTIYTFLQISYIFLRFLENSGYESVARFKAILYCIKNFRNVWRKHLYNEYVIRRVDDEQLIEKFMLKSISVILKERLVRCLSQD